MSLIRKRAVVALAVVLSAAFFAPGLQASTYGAYTRRAHTEYECLQPLMVSSFKELLNKYSLEHGTDWNQLGSLSLGSNPNLKIIHLTIDSLGLMGSLNLNIDGNGFVVGLRALTVPRELISVMRLANSQTLKDLPRHVRRKLLELNSSYHLFIDQISQTIEGPEEAARADLRSSGFREATVDALMKSRFGKRIIQFEMEKIESAVRDLVNFNVFIPEDHPYQALLQKGFLVFTDEDVGFILARDLKSFAICPKVVKGVQTIDRTALVSKLFKFLTDVRVIEILRCESLLVN